MNLTLKGSGKKKLNEVAGRGHQSVFRVYLDYPNSRHAVPKFLLEQGHKLIRYKNNDADNQGGLSPDYNDPELLKSMVSSIHALGEKYDGDPRIAFITVGYLGHWGEWHTYPNEQIMAKREVQVDVLKAFGKAFSKTHFLLRYPDMAIEEVNCGFHDDSFVERTLFHKQRPWHFMNKVKEAGLESAWEKSPIGGEVYPPLQSQLFKGEDSDLFLKCVGDSHCSWLLNQHLFNKECSEQENKNARMAAKKMGYEFYVSSYSYADGVFKVKLKIGVWLLFIILGLFC